MKLLTLFRRGRSSTAKRQDGKTVETAFVLPPVSSASAVNIEYLTLGKIYGKEGQNWRVHDRIRSVTSQGRHIEKFILGTASGRQMVHFDITKCLSISSQEFVDEALDLSDVKYAPQEITFPKVSYLVMCKALIDVEQAFAETSFNTEVLLEKLSHSITNTHLEDAQTITCTLPVSDWVRLIAFTRIIDATPVQQEHIADFRNLVEAALRQTKTADA